MKKSVAVLACLLLAAPALVGTPAQALDPMSVAKVFTKYVEDKSL